MKITRKTMITLLMLTAALLLPLSAQADPPDDQCYSPLSSDGHHDWRNAGSTPSTCTEMGSVSWQCYFCDRTYIEYFPTAEHTWGPWEEYLSCESEGSRQRQCLVCQTRESETLPPAGHAWDSGKVTMPATCTAQGVMTFTCSRCGAARIEAIEKTSHQPEKVTEVYPTCTESGSSFYKCAICGEKLTDPDSLPPLGHSFGEWRIETPSTCAERGMKVRKCRRCGYDDYQYIAPLEHEWEEGTVTKSAGVMNSGEKTYICARCGETKTEAIPALNQPEALFGALRNVSPEAANAEYSGGLWIVTEPEGGQASLDESAPHTLSVAAEGGVPPYTYEWHWVAEKLPNLTADDLGSADANGLKYAVSGAFESRKDQFAQAKETGGSVASALFFGQGKEPDSSIEKSDEESSNAFSGVEDLNDRIVSSGPEAEYAASQPGEYYVVVRDQIGSEVYSAHVTVAETLYFTKQPENANLHGQGSVTLTCNAGGGSGVYLYCLRDTETGELVEKELSHGAVTVSQPGVYVFEVDDITAGEQAVSQAVTVYDADPLTVSVLADVGLNENESAVLTATVTGGVEPYAYQWQRQVNGQDSAFPAFADLPEAAEASFEITSAELGRYQVTVTDAMGETAAASALVASPLTIIKQPEGADLSDGSTAFYLDVEISEGTAPYTYTLLMEGEALDSKQTHLTTCEFEITQSGVYAIHIEDAGGRFVTSQYVNVRNMALNILSNTYAASVAQLGRPVMLRVKAAGGVEPYTYSWIKVDRSADFEACDAGSDCITPDFEGDAGEYAVKEPFTSWKCIVTDADGMKATAYPMYVNMEGSLLIITEQPQSAILDDSMKPYRAVLNCKALASSGHPLTYTWEEKGVNGWETCGFGGTLTLEEKITETNHYYFTGGTYRCRIRDTVTGDETVSEEATVKLPPLQAKAYQVEKSMTVKLEIEGGAEPYTVTCERWRNVHEASGGVYGILNYSFDLTGHEADVETDGHKVVFTYDNMARWDKGSGTGEWYIQYRPWVYVFTITDTMGNTTEVDTGKMNSDI